MGFDDEANATSLKSDQFRFLSLAYLQKTLSDMGAKIGTSGREDLDLVAQMPDGESLGIFYQCCRILNESLQRTFEARDQACLRAACSKRNLTPVFACVVVTSDEPSKLHVIIIKLDDLISMTNSGGVRWLCYSDKRGIILHFNSNKGYMKEIKSNPHVFYAAYTL